jgi:hypothetical protein
MDNTSRRGSAPRPEDLPLPPQPSASLECLLTRLPRIHVLLLRRGFSDAVVWSAVDEVLDIGRKALETGKAAGMSDAQRAGWLWKAALHAACRAVAKEPAFVSLTFEPPNNHRLSVDDDEGPLFAVLRRELDCLPEKKRQAVILCALEGLSLRDGARAMGVCPSTVEYHLKSGCAQLAQALSGYLPRGFPSERAARRRAQAPLN